jgi:hypothetical protein
MKAIISKILLAGTIIIGLSLSAQAATPYQTKKDTDKMAKMSKMDKKMDKKKTTGKMAKDTGKMKKM